MAQVPSNLIPTRVTQLQYAPVASEDSLLLIVYNGSSYKIRAGDLLAVAGVPTSRQVIAGTGLTGGGALSSNVTLSIAAGGVGSTQLAPTGVTANTYGSATAIPVLTIDATGRVTAATTIPPVISSLAGGSANRIAYQTAADSTSFISAPSAANTVLTWNGTGFTWTSAAIGTVSNVTATAPLFSSGGSTPNLTIPQATATTSGYLSGSDWTVFNNKQGALSITTTGTSGPATLVGNVLNIPQYSGGGGGSGTVTSVSATAPLSVNFPTTTPAITIAQATTSTSGYLTSTDWNTFNNKQPAGAYLTTVTADSPLTGSGTSASHLSIPAATTSISGYLTSTDWNTFNNKVGAITSTDGSVTITGTTTVDLSVAVAASTNNVLCQVRNTTGATLTKGTVVYITGATGQLPTVSKALASSDATSAQTLGLMTADLANNSNGNVTIIGLVTNIDTSAYADGQQLYLSGTTAGTLTATKPKAPTHLVYVAVVEYAHPVNGKLFVKVQNGYELDEIHDVQITSPANGQTIIYDSATSLWKNALVNLASNVTGNLSTTNLGGGSGATSLTFWRGDGTWATPIDTGITSVSVTSANGLAGTSSGGSTPSLTLSTTITGLLKGNGTAISAASSGTDYAPATSGNAILYGNGAGGFSSVSIGSGVNFSGGILTATGSGGTVTSVAALTLGTTGTDLSSTVANGTTTPVITLNVPTASATNRGVLSAANWSTFNGKQDAITLTTTGTSGAATLVGSTLNIPNYASGGGSGTVTTSGTPTTNYLSKFTGSTVIGNSLVTDNGTTVSVNNASPTATNTFEVNGTFGLTASGSRTITSSGTDVTISQTGDTYGTTYLKLQNRFGANGAIFGSPALDLVDFGFLPSSGVQSNLRLEHRSSAILSSNTLGEFQFLIDSINGTTYAFRAGAGAFSVYSPNIILGQSSAATITLSGAVSASSSVGTAGQLFQSNGSGAAPSWGRTITSGTAAPSGGSDGDIYLQYV